MCATKKGAFMKTIRSTAKWLTALALGFSNLAGAQNYPVAHWINDAGQSAPTVLNTNGIFITDFKATDDLKVTRLTSDSVSSYTDVFGGATPGNNPWYLTNFVGVATNGTGDGVAGDIVDLEMTVDATGALQFDFLTPLTPHDRILLVDVDGAEQYVLQAYVVNGSSSNLVSFVGWPTNDYSGTTGIIPNSSWPLWNPASGTLTSGSSTNLNEELFVLTPAQNINRLVVTKLNVSTWSTDITFITVEPPLTFLKSGTNVILTWPTNYIGFTLESTTNLAPISWNLNLPSSVVIGGQNVVTNPITGKQQFFRLQHP
jgi:hypothetical protein